MKNWVFANCQTLTIGQHFLLFWIELDLEECPILLCINSHGWDQANHRDQEERSRTDAKLNLWVNETRNWSLAGFIK